MAKIDVIRAWKDKTYRQKLSEKERQSLPPNPAGLIELTDLTLETVSGQAPEPNPAFTIVNYC